MLGVPITYRVKGGFFGCLALVVAGYLGTQPEYVVAAPWLYLLLLFVLAAAGFNLLLAWLHGEGLRPEGGAGARYDRAAGRRYTGGEEEARRQGEFQRNEYRGTGGYYQEKAFSRKAQEEAEQFLKGLQTKFFDTEVEEVPFKSILKEQPGYPGTLRPPKQLEAQAVVSQGIYCDRYGYQDTSEGEARSRFGKERADQFRYDGRKTYEAYNQKATASIMSRPGNKSADLYKGESAHNHSLSVYRVENHPYLHQRPGTAKKSTSLYTGTFLIKQKATGCSVGPRRQGNRWIRTRTARLCLA